MAHPASEPTNQSPLPRLELLSFQNKRGSSIWNSEILLVLRYGTKMIVSCAVGALLDQLHRSLPGQWIKIVKVMPRKSTGGLGARKTCQLIGNFEVLIVTTSQFDFDNAPFCLVQVSRA